MIINDSVVLSRDTLTGVSAFILLFFFARENYIPFYEERDKIAIFMTIILFYVLERRPRYVGEQVSGELD